MQDVSFWQAFWGVMGACQVVVMWATQVPPKQVISHAADWAKTFGIRHPPEWLESENADRLIRHVAAIILVFSILAVTVPLVDLGKVALGPKLLFAGGIIAICAAIVWNLIAGSLPSPSPQPLQAASAIAAPIPQPAVAQPAAAPKYTPREARCLVDSLPGLKELIRTKIELRDNDVARIMMRLRETTYKEPTYDEMIPKTP
jgi:hypothetical protein